MRGIDGGKLVKGVKLFVACDKHGSLLDLELRPANTDDRAGTLPMLLLATTANGAMTASRSGSKPRAASSCTERSRMSRMRLNMVRTIAE